MKIYAVMIAMVKAVHALSRKVQQHDPDLGAADEKVAVAACR